MVPGKWAPTFRAKVVKRGKGLVVRLPDAFGLNPGDEVEIHLRRVDTWPPGYFDLEPSPEFPMPD
jgi:hypothetical protein